MSFELHITCSKDIDKLKIDFSDGTSVVTEHDKPKKKSTPKKDPEKKDSVSKTSQDYIPLDTDFSQTKQDIVEKPVIPSQDRPIKVAEELQQLDI